MIQNKFSDLKPAHLAQTLSPPRIAALAFFASWREILRIPAFRPSFRVLRVFRVNTLFPLSHLPVFRCLASQASPVINPPRIRVDSRNSFRLTSFKNKLIQAFSKQIKANQSNSNQKK